VEYPLKFVEAAAFLRELADTLEKGGKVEIDLAQRQIQIDPDEPVTLEISYKEDAKKKKLEVELEIKEHFGAAGEEGGRPTVR
jgi:amphi-Trp domain-containing protein